MASAVDQPTFPNTLRTPLSKPSNDLLLHLSPRPSQHLPTPHRGCLAHHHPSGNLHSVAVSSVVATTSMMTAKSFGLQHPVGRNSPGTTGATSVCAQVIIHMPAQASASGLAITVPKDHHTTDPYAAHAQHPHRRNHHQLLPAHLSYLIPVMSSPHHPGSQNLPTVP